MTDHGRDVYCLDSLSTGRMASGTRLVAQRCYHRLTTPRGTLRGGPDEGNFGLDLASLCGSATSAQLKGAIGPRIEAELLKDEHVAEVTATVESSTVSGETTWAITVDVVCSDGPFQLVLAVDAVTVELLNMEAL